MDFRHPSRSQHDRTRRENRHLNFYTARDKLRFESVRGFGFVPAYALFFLPVLTANRCFNVHEGSTSGFTH
jgi:hypothetical protein